MRLNSPLERIIEEIHSLDRGGCIAELRTLPRLRLDFTAEYLERMTLEQLRHVLMAACLQARKPAPCAPAAHEHIRP